MSNLKETDKEIETLRKRLRKLESKRKLQTEVATLNFQLRKAKMRLRLGEMLGTPFVKSVRNILVKACEDQVIQNMRKSLIGTKKTEHPNSMVI